MSRLGDGAKPQQICIGGLGKGPTDTGSFCFRTGKSCHLDGQGNYGLPEGSTYQLRTVG